MVNQIVVCGDSFGCGLGINESCDFERSFGGVVSSHFNIPFKIYARPGCCNYVIYLQVQKVISEYRLGNYNPFVLITTTNHARFTFPSDHSTGAFTNYIIEDVDYSNYMPYSEISKHRRELPFEFNNPPKLVSDTIGNIMHHIGDPDSSLGPMFKDIRYKAKAIKLFYEYLYDDSIKQLYDYSLILMMHKCLNEVEIPHIILDYSTYHCKFIDKKNFLQSDWGKMCSKYPDKINSGHCDERGHNEVAQLIIDKIEIDHNGIMR